MAAYRSAFGPYCVVHTRAPLPISPLSLRKHHVVAAVAHNSYRFPDITQIRLRKLVCTKWHHAQQTQNNKSDNDKKCIIDRSRIENLIKFKLNFHYELFFWSTHGMKHPAIVHPQSVGIRSLIKCCARYGIAWCMGVGQCPAMASLAIRGPINV